LYAVEPSCAKAFPSQTAEIKRMASEIVSRENNFIWVMVSSVYGDRGRRYAPTYILNVKIPWVLHSHVYFEAA
jgi:hypothetical protein